MEIVVDLQAVTVILAAADDTDHFALRVADPGASASSEADVHRLGDVLVASNTGRLEDADRAFVRPDAVRFFAEGQVDEGWASRFGAMCAFAGEKGWMDPTGWIQAHVVWPAVTPAVP
jgi:hypothetical protein